MKRTLVFFLLLILISTHFETIFGTFQEEESSIDVLLPRVQEIFEVRTDIWNKLLEDSEEKNLTKFQLELKEYVEGPLLLEDLKTFQQMLEIPTSFEKIINFKIEECSVLETSNGITKVFLNIYWELEGYEGHTHKNVNYFAELTQRNDTWFLRDYRVAMLGY